MNALPVIAALLLGGAVYFLVTWMTMRSRIASMSRVEHDSLLIAQAAADRENKPWRERLTDNLKARGWDGNAAPLLLALGLVATTVTLGLTLVGLNPIVSVLGGCISSLASVYIVDVYVTNRRQLMFNKQLVQVLELLVAEIEAGNGPQQAMQRIPYSLPEPARTEFAGAADRVHMGQTLDEAVAPIAKRYPSRAMRMLMSALKIDRQAGAKIQPALTQASDSLRKEMELVSESQAELAQTQFEFVFIAGIFIVVLFMMIFGTGQTATYLTNPIGIAVILIAIGNALLGVWRAFRMISRVKRIS